VNHVCTCKNGNRHLMLFVPKMADRFPELPAYAETDPTWRCENDVVRIQVGSGHTFEGVVEVANFLRTLLETERLAEIKAAWVSAETAGWDPQAFLGATMTLAQMTAKTTGPLLSILQSGKLTTHFQPVFDRDLSLWGYECLMRAKGDDGKMISPAQLIDWAKQEQLVFMLDRVCRETHLRNAGKAGVPKHANLLINFMSTAIYKPEYCLQTTMAAAREAGIAPSRVIFEVVEQYEVKDPDHLRNILQFYRQHGFRTALDDLGSGYAGLSLLADLSPDLIKIDRELINKSVASPMHRAVCEALVRIGKQTGKTVLAEGIEMADELDLMLNLGCDLFQGYYLGKPAAVPVTEPLTHATKMAA